MSFKGTVERFAVWDGMAVVERAVWVTVDPAHPQAVTLREVRADGWDVPPLASVGGPADDSGVPVVVSSVQGPAEGRKIVDRATFDAKIAGFDEANRKALENAMKAADKASADLSDKLAAVTDPAIRAALEALAGRNTKGSK